MIKRQKGDETGTKYTNDKWRNWFEIKEIVFKYLGKIISDNKEWTEIGVSLSVYSIKTCKMFSPNAFCPAKHILN